MVLSTFGSSGRFLPIIIKGDVRVLHRMKGDVIHDQILIIYTRTEDVL